LPDFSELAHNLLTLEINTVLKDGMSAQRMPSASDALIDTAQEYHIFLCQRARDIAIIGTSLPPWARRLSDSFDWGVEPFAAPVRDAAPGAAAGRPPKAFDEDYLKRYPSQVSETDLDKLREIAAWLREMRDRIRAAAAGHEDANGRRLLHGLELAEAERAAGRLNPEHDPVLFRIQRTCDQLKALQAKLGGTATRGSKAESPAGLPAEDFVLLRKAWDIGTEIIVMQTVVQIDGDVVSRILPGRESTAFAHLHALHSEAVSISFRHWRFLVATLGRMAGKAVDTLFRR
jgi:hypothetical protein